jgi:hypothetical protein
LLRKYKEIVKNMLILEGGRVRGGSKAKVYSRQDNLPQRNVTDILDNSLARQGEHKVYELFGQSLGIPISVHEKWAREFVLSTNDCLL